MATFSESCRAAPHSPIHGVLLVKCTPVSTTPYRLSDMEYQLPLITKIAHRETHLCHPSIKSGKEKTDWAAPRAFTHFHYPRCSWAFDGTTSAPNGSCWVKGLSPGPSRVPPRPSPHTHKTPGGRWTVTLCSFSRSRFPAGRWCS